MDRKLTAVDADALNVGKSVEPGANSEDDPTFHKEGDSVMALPLPDGTAVVVTGVSGGVLTGVVLGAAEDAPKPRARKSTK